MKRLPANKPPSERTFAQYRLRTIYLAAFIIIFALFGSYLLYISRASAPVGDINNDGTVNVTDLSLLLSSYGQHTGACASAPQYTCDLNSDGAVNIVDLSVLLSHWGQTGSNSSNPILGVNYVGAVSTYLPAFQSVGITSVRVFALYQPNLEALLANFAAHNIHPMLVMDEATFVNGTLKYCHASKSQTVNSDTQIVQAFLQAYGSSYQGWFEFGNEPNTSPGNCGYTAAQYAAGWNAVIPQLKALAPNAWFGGPVLPNTDTVYISSFLQQASPKPEFVSWHLYAGSYTWSTSQLQSSWQGWGSQIGSVKTAVNAALGHSAPLMITEWNYAWDGGVGPDRRVTPLTTSTFSQTFTQSMLSQFQSAGITASYNFDDPSFPSPVGTTPSDPSFGQVTPMGNVFSTFK